MEDPEKLLSKAKKRYTLREVLLFSLFSLEFNLDHMHNLLEEGQTDTKIRYFWPAPEGGCYIKEIGHVVVLTISGSC